MKKLIIAVVILSGLLNAECFVKNSFNVNSVTALMWSPLKTNTLNKDYECGQSEEGGYNDWRLPNINELLTIKKVVGDDNSCRIQGSDELLSSTKYELTNHEVIYYYFDSSGKLQSSGSSRTYRCVRDIK